MFVLGFVGGSIFGFLIAAILGGVQMKIVHAVCDENGKTVGTKKGDQTGKEIRVQEWYDRSGGWKFYLEPIDPYTASKAVKIAVDVAGNIHFGYSQPNRKTGYNAIKRAGGDVSKVTEYGDFDCSSLVYSAYMLAGCEGLDAIGYSGDIVEMFQKTGMFIVHTEPKFLKSGDYAVKGGVYVAPNEHVFMCIEDGKYAVHTKTQTEEKKEEEQPKEKKKYVRAKGSVYVRDYPVSGKKIMVLHNGEKLEYIGRDNETGWYNTTKGYITDKSRYTEVVEL